MPNRAAGLLMYRRRNPLEVFLVHPGGPFWAKKDLAAWTLPKGEYDDNEEPLAAAIREFREETSFEPHEPYLDLGTIRQTNGKLVHAWAFEGDCDPATLTSINTQTEWPPRSRHMIDIPELDRVAFFSIADAKPVINVAQGELLERLVQKTRIDV